MPALATKRCYQGDVSARRRPTARSHAPLLWPKPAERLMTSLDGDGPVVAPLLRLLDYNSQRVAMAGDSGNVGEEGGKMNEIKESLRNIEQTYKIFQQQQFTFIAALEHTRENAHDKIRPVSTIGQVQTYMDHYCNNSTDKRILLMFLNICSDLSRLCQRLETLHSGNATTNALLDKCKTLVSHSNDLSAIRAKYPHDVVNHLSCDEARNHYGGVVSLIPIVLDCMKEWVAHSEKLPRNMMQSVSARREAIYHQRELPNLNMGPRKGMPPFVTEGTQTSLSLTEKARLREKRGEAKIKEMGTLGRAIHKFLDGPWRAPGKNAF
ncbi:sperm acrosome-associated protein 9 isoform X2 [Sceloporus undulatus]|uniref:sperm acrosome-associated protein 9 isoform X2 n=1 Tax=Sceloporus undulatus TaxID=8520 RepID=UPI001C4C5998|nr:sperm acrosome-associated protein 9 isoform X2 [Sceloporus undulatus]